MEKSQLISANRPPRHLTWLTRLVVLFGSASSFGWAFLGFGLLAVWIFVPKGDYASDIVMRGEVGTASAIITQVEETRFSEGGGRGRKGTPIFAYNYKFTTSGIDYEGTSYHAGIRENQGEHVTVEFLLGKPDYSRIQGMRRAVYGSITILTFVFPAVGLGSIFLSLRSQSKILRLLANGEIAEGRLVNKPTTNNLGEYKLAFTLYGSQGRVRQVYAETFRPEFGNDRPELLFYYRNGRSTVRLGELPGNLVLTERGKIKPRSMSSVFWALRRPLITLGAVVGGIISRSM